MAALCFPVTIHSSIRWRDTETEVILLSPQKTFLLCLQEKVQYGLSSQKYPDTKAKETFSLSFMSVASIIKLSILRGGDK